MTSHDWARELKQTAEFLLARTEVEIGVIPETKGWFFSNKEAFIGMVRATFPGKKVMDEHYVNFRPSGARIEFTIMRNLVCRKVQDVRYECEPLLSPREDAEMEETTSDRD